MRYHQQAFTLVEVLVVLVILGLTVTFTTLGFQRLEGDRLGRQAGHLSAWLQDVSDSAVLDGAVYGVWLEEGRLASAYYFDNRWWRRGGEGVVFDTLAADTTVYLDSGQDWRVLESAKEDGAQPAPVILFLPTGLAIPERFQLRSADSGVATLARDDNGLYGWSVQ